jgi:hypothetical protein
MVREHPKRLAMGAAAVVTALGLCAIPGMPAALALLLVVGAVGFGFFQLYAAYAMTSPAPVPADEAKPERKEALTPKPGSATRTVKTSSSPKPEAPRVAKKKQADPSATALAPRTQAKSFKVKAAAPQVQAASGVSGRLTTESAVARRCRAMSKVGEWGDTPEIIALGREFGRTVHIVTSTHTQTLEIANAPKPDVFLYFNGKNHYDGFQDGQIKKVPGDGNCLFHAFGMQVKVDDVTARERAVKWLEANEKTIVTSGATVEAECTYSNIDLLESHTFSQFDV